jgi:hypothetical protein
VLGGGRSDSKTAEDLSKSLGEHEVERETLGETANYRGGSRSRTTRIERERVVMPSEIQSLPELAGYLAFAGDLPIARVKLVPQHYRCGIRRLSSSAILTPSRNRECRPGGALFLGPGRLLHEGGRRHLVGGGRPTARA